MSHLFWVLIFALPALGAQRAIKTIQTTIHDYEEGTKNHPTLIFLSTGDVTKLSDDSDELNLQNIQRLVNEETLVEISIDEKRNILKLKEITSRPSTPPPIAKNVFTTYDPTVLNNEQEANQIFEDLNPEYRRVSQCYNRAHIWSLESFNKYQLKTMKAFLFFTKKYIREYDYEWWFHVAPYTLVLENGAPMERVLDYKFSETPLSMKDWTDVFMLNKVECPVVSKYSEYGNHTGLESCFLIKVSMYYYQPLDLQALESGAAIRNSWIDWEVKNAYRQGFYWWWKDINNPSTLEL